MISKKYLIIAGVVILVVGYSTGYFTKPTKVETRTVEVEKIKTVVKDGGSKTLYKKKVIKPDGTIEEIEVSKEEWDKISTGEADTTKKQDIVVKNDIGLNVSAFAISRINDLMQPEYGIHITKRIVGGVTLGALATTDKKIGVSIGMEF